MFSDIFSMGSYFMKHDTARHIRSGMPFEFYDCVFYITERAAHLHLCKHRTFRLYIGDLKVFKKVQEIDCQEKFALIEATAV